MMKFLPNKALKKTFSINFNLNILRVICKQKIILGSLK